MSDLVIVIPTYRPPASVIGLVHSLGLSAPVIVSDDASPCTFDPILNSLGSIEQVSVIRHLHNQGIGRGLNDGLHFAYEVGASWLLTVDQDSLVTPTYVEDLTTYASEILEGHPRLGVVGAGTVSDASGLMRYPVTERSGIPSTDEVIQSGSLWRVSALVDCGGFDERLGNDGVDAAACLGLRENRYLVCIAPHITFEHRIGNAQQVRLLGHRVILTGHSHERQRAMLRNRLTLFPREFRQSPKHGIRTLRRVAVNLSLGRLLNRESGPHSC